MKTSQRVIFPVLIFLLVTSCHTKKSTLPKLSSLRGASEKKEYFSKRFGVTLDRESDLKLYTAIDKWLGVKYKFGSCSRNGIDCSCLVNEVFKEAYQCHTPRDTRDLLDKVKEIDKDELREGDLVFFRMKKSKIDHVGIYLSENKFVHASTKGGVMISSLDENPFKKKFKSGGRLRCS